MKKNILITGGGGYIGTELCNYLSNYNYNIFALDTFWFGKKLNKKIKIIRKDIRYIKEKEFPKKISTVIHLAAISNDPSAELNSKLSWEVNVLGLLNILNLSLKNKVKKFIFASSGSVYGVKKEKQVIENLSLIPISDYNKTKMVGEKLVESFSNKMKTIILRPATVCGISKNLRLDLTINMLTYDAVKKGVIKVFGGEQYRPNLSLTDMIRAYKFFLEKNFTGIFNIGFENEKIINIANKITQNLKNTKILVSKSNDKRSYRLSSKKITKIGYKQSSSIKNEIDNLKRHFLSKNFIYTNSMIRINFLKKKIKSL